MDAHPSPSPASGPSLRLPSIVSTLVIYAGCLAISLIPPLFVAAEWTQHFWLTLPFSIFASLTPIALFLAAVVINEKRAVLVPICGVFASALILHYLRYTPSEFQSQFSGGGLEQLQLRADLWDAIKFPLPVALLVTGLGIVAARWWSPRVESDPVRTTLPEVRPALYVFAVCLVPFAILTSVALRVHVFPYPYRVFDSAAGEFALIAMFCICAVALRPWTVLLPLAMVTTTAATILSQPGGCFGANAADCWSFASPILRNLFIIEMVIFLIAVIAGALAREDSSPLTADPLADELVLDS